MLSCIHNNINVSHYIIATRWESTRVHWHYQSRRRLTSSARCTQLTLDSCATAVLTIAAARGTTSRVVTQPDVGLSLGSSPRVPMYGLYYAIRILPYKAIFAIQDNDWSPGQTSGGQEKCAARRMYIMQICTLVVLHYRHLNHTQFYPKLFIILACAFILTN